MRSLALLVAVSLVLAPGAAASSHRAPAAEHASECVYAANNPVKHTDKNGLIADTPGEHAEAAAISLGMTPIEQAGFVEEVQASALVASVTPIVAYAAAELLVGAAIASAEGIVATGTALGSTLGIGGEAGVVVTSGAAAATAVAAGATAVQIGTTLQMSGNRGERNKTRSSQGTSNPEKAARKTRDHQTGKKTNEAQPTRTKAQKKADRAARKEAKDQEQAKRLEELKKELEKADEKKDP